MTLTPYRDVPRLVPGPQSTQGAVLRARSWTRIRAFVGGQIILSAFSGVFTFFGLQLIQSQYAVLLNADRAALRNTVSWVFAALLVSALLGLLQSWQTARWTVVIIFVVTKFADTVRGKGELFGIWVSCAQYRRRRYSNAYGVVWLYHWAHRQAA